MKTPLFYLRNLEETHLKGSCEGANDAQNILTKACVGQKSCLVDVSENTSGKGKSCGNEAKRLAVESLLTMMVRR
ncbi:Beta-galactosidase 15 [Bienertia sinuspersici]